MRHKQLAHGRAPAAPPSDTPVPLQMSTTLLARARACVLPLATLALAACAAGDSDGAPFNADGTTADLVAIAETFRTPAVASFAASRGLIDGALATPGVASVLQAVSAPTGARFGSEARAFVRHARLAATRAEDSRPAGAALLPERVLGATLAWEPSRGRYVPGREPGAPANGARLVLYTIDAATGRPARPLRPVGHVDVTDATTPAGGAVRLRVIAGATTWLDYVVSADRTSESAAVDMRGFVSNGADRISFDIRTVYALEDSTDGGRMDYRIGVPSRDLALQWTVALGALGSAAEPMTLDLALGSADGSVLVSGQVTGGTGTLHALANNVPVATLSVSGRSVALQRPDGAELDPAEARALRQVLASVEDASRLSRQLLAPVASVM
jgi:hypothetical protein